MGPVEAAEVSGMRRRHVMGWDMMLCGVKPTRDEEDGLGWI